MSKYHVDADNLGSYLETQASKDTLRFITCGSVDDGKSTLIGRLLYEAKVIFDDQLAALDADSRKYGTQAGKLDFALLVDGLAAEREQGITIDVAYRYFSTDKRNFIVADTPGHEQYTRNMATGASTAHVAVIIVDARKGVLDQTRRHAFIASLLGIRHVVLAINKMDLVDYAKERFDAIVADFLVLNKTLNFMQIIPIPISALNGDNVTNKSENMPWYEGQYLLGHLETLDSNLYKNNSLRLPVQYVLRPNSDYRGYAGRVGSGILYPGLAVKILPSGKETNIQNIFVGSEEVTEAIGGQSVTVTIAGEFDISRGDLIADASAAPSIADQFRVTIIWMSDSAMLPGRKYLLRTETSNYDCKVAKLRHRININDYTKAPANTLDLNDIASCDISLNRPLAFDAYSENKSTGSFILIDPESNATIAAGMIDFALRRSQNIHWQVSDIEADHRAIAKNQQPCVLWFTGLSGSGKSTIANLIEKKLHTMSRHTMLLDGDNIRHGLNRDLGFTDADRVENIRRVAEVSKLMVEAGLITLVSFISPFAAERKMARELFKDGAFVEIYVNTPIAEAERRDVKGLYKKARSGALKNFTGIDSAYEPPVSPEITLSTMELEPDAAADVVVDWLKRCNYI